MKIIKKGGVHFNNVWPLLVLLLLHFGCSDSAENFTEFLYDLAEIDVNNRSTALEEWLKKQEEFPIINGSEVYFLFKEKREVPVFLSGDMNKGISEPAELLKIIGTDYYYVRQVFPMNSASEYVFTVNGRHFLDPLNKKIFKSARELKSVLFMPDYIYPRETLRRINNLYTKLDTLDFNKNKVYLYRHMSVQSNSPVIVFVPGKEYLEVAEANIILDNLTHSKKIEPCFAVFPADNINLADLLPFLKKEKILTGNKKILGGNTKTGSLMLENPGIINNFNAVFLQSGFNSKDSMSITNILAKIDFSSKRIFLSYGYFEKRDSLYNRVIEFFKDRTPYLKYEKYNEGASWLSWKGHLDDALIHCLSK